ncbi:glycosyltransferase [Pedobacter aquatilis]|uniref:glycosyltransferase n=1 Tax=Pedobacter aquatilis TaxID=351343 RepID=UPI0025B57856|nr:glycosyltransferase [Pedobacter aquatilis]MDN3586234.1 glycosyltransferase [Pedobacter aquatilis]
MAVNIAFYIHHHGSGHLMRTLQILKHLKNNKVILFGSGLNAVANLPANVEVVHLPLDVAVQTQPSLVDQRALSMLHYAPLLISGITERVAILTAAFKKFYPIILVVDVSVEVTLLARLSGIPTIVVRQHGQRTDDAHLMGYESAQRLIAPFSKSLHVGKEDWIFEKTIFTGGFSRFDGRKSNAAVVKNRIVILIGSGGSSINPEFISYLASQCKSFDFHILGQITSGEHCSNVRYLQHCSDPFEELSQAAIVIGNTGHNTVMEVASLNKNFVGIPEPRPFFEQEEKAASIELRSGVEIIHPSKIYQVNWPQILSNLCQTAVDWDEVITEDAVEKFAAAISDTAQELGIA